ncbi:GDP-mannose 4,6-dehydratase [Candidatus Woesearchaeota archaeon]|nr:GDP-mannose 4,6-dehydratase [Candidatus Woesearchaeota archaeon]
MKKASVLVTGSSGFVGKWLVRALERKGIPVLKFDHTEGKSVARWEDLKGIAAEASGTKGVNGTKSTNGISHVFHLAGLAAVGASREKPREYFEVNSFGTLNVCELCRITGARLIFASSYLYGAPQYLPVDEKHPLNPFNPYAHSKYLAEEFIKAYQKDFGMKAIILRMFNIYGPGQGKDFLIGKIISQLGAEAGTGGAAVELGDPEPKRDFTFVEDAVEAYLRAMAFPGEGVFNIGSGKSYSVREIAEKLAKLHGKPVKMTFSGERRKNEVMDCRADIAKAKKELRWEPTISIDAGLTLALRGKKA